MAFGFWEAILSFLTRQVGLRTDAADPAGSLHAKLRMHPSVGFPLIKRWGTYADGNYSPSSNQNLTKNLYFWNSVNIPAGVTVTAPSPGVVVFADNITISGLLTASGKGAVGGAAVTSAAGNNGASGGGYYGGGGGGGGGSNNTNLNGGAGGSGRGAGGAGGTWSPVTAGSPGQNAPTELINVVYPATLQLVGGGGGSGASLASSTSGAGGAGGGFIIINCRTLTVNSGGAIRADGINGGNATGISAAGGGGGGGGLILVVAELITNNGVISANGGAGGTGVGSSANGGAGGNGTVLLLIA